MKQTIVIIDDLYKTSDEVVRETRLLIYRLYNYYSKEYCKDKNFEICFKLITKSDYIHKPDFLKPLYFKDLDETERPNMEVYMVDYDKDNKDNIKKIKEKLGVIRKHLTKGETLSVLIDIMLFDHDIQKIKDKNGDLNSIKLYVDCKRKNDRVFCYTSGYNPGVVSYVNSQYNKFAKSYDLSHEKIKVYQRREIDGTLGWNKKIADELIGK